MSSDDNFEIDNSPGDDVVADGIEQESGNDTEVTDVSLRQPVVDEETRADVNTLHCDDERAGAPPEAQIPDAPGEEEEEKEGEVKSGNGDLDSRAPAVSAEPPASSKRAHRGPPARAGAARRLLIRQGLSEKRPLGRGKNHPGVAEDSDRGYDSSDESNSGRRRSSVVFGARSADCALDKIPSLSKNPSSTETRVWFRQVLC